jgi:cytochrome c553/cytochrome c2
MALWVAVATTAMPVLAKADELQSSVARGGRLYDNWYMEIKEPGPARPHPAYPADKTYTNEPKRTWRCQECHGWDYLGKDGAYGTGPHYTGIKGIRGMAGADPETIIAVLENDVHGYDDLMGAHDFRDLANFVSKGQVDMHEYIDRATNRAKGDEAKRKPYYTTICANCHGMDGLKITTMLPLGRVANSNPWEALHKILNGHPAENMPALRALDRQVLVDVLAYAQTLPVEDEIQSSIARGGRLYDNWYKETRASPPTKSHPAYPADKMYANDPKRNWRCQECHGWDYLGKDGAYGTGSHYTGIKGIRGMAGADPENIIAVLKNNAHGYLWLLDERNFQDLANFVSKGQVDMDKHIDRATNRAKGDKTKRKPYYTTICANCHGTDGLKVRSIPPLGKIARENPWEALHNIRNGHPAENMPVLRALDSQILVDLLAYVQTLPAEEELLSSIARGGRLYDNWYKEIKAQGLTKEVAVQVPTRSHPAYPADKMYANEPKRNWRCKECHGWDYLGRDGAYGTGPHYTGIEGIRGMAGADPETIVAVLKNDVHGYDELMGAHDFRDLANFVSKGQVDMDKYIDRATNRARGDKAEREPYYTTICANCHGIDGLKITTMLPLGRVAKSNPWEALHKILNGHPAENMPALRALDKQVLVDVLAYVQTLPAEKY